MYRRCVRCGNILSVHCDKVICKNCSNIRFIFALPGKERELIVPDKFVDMDIEDSETQYVISLFYWQISNNMQQAFKWCEKSIKNGNAKSVCLMGDFYYSGIGVDKNEQRAHEYYEAAATSGNELAKLRLRESFKENWDEQVKFREELATRFWKVRNIKKMKETGLCLCGSGKKSYECCCARELILPLGLHNENVGISEKEFIKRHFDSDMMYVVAHMFGEGNGTLLNMSQEFAWLAVAAKHGNKRSMLNISFIYTYGYGVVQDIMRGSVYFAHYDEKEAEILTRFYKTNKIIEFIDKYVSRLEKKQKIELEAKDIMRKISTNPAENAVNVSDEINVEIEKYLSQW